MPWATEGKKTNPTANTLLADTGPLPEGVSYSPQVAVSTSVIVQAVLERRNAANSATLQSHTFYVPANTSFVISAGGYLPLIASERVRVIVGASVTGTVQGSLFW